MSETITGYLDKLYSQDTKLILYIDGYYEGISGGDFDDRLACEKVFNYMPKKYSKQIYIITTDDRIKLTKEDYEKYDLGGIYSSTDIDNIVPIMEDENTIQIITGPIKDMSFAKLVKPNAYTQGDETGYNCISSIKLPYKTFSGINSVSPQVRTIVKTTEFDKVLSQWASKIEISKNLFPAKPNLPYALQLLVTKNQTTYRNCLSIILKKLKINNTFNTIKEAYEYLLSYDIGLYPLDKTGLNFSFNGPREKIIYGYVSQIDFKTSNTEQLKRMYGEALMSLSIVILAGKMQQVKIDGHYLYSDEWFKSGKGLPSMSDIKICDIDVNMMDELMAYDIPTMLLGLFQLDTSEFVKNYLSEGYSANNPIPYERMMDMMVEMINKK